MSVLDSAFSTFVIVGHQAITLTERTVIDDWRILDLRVDDAARGELRLLHCYQPRVAISASHVAIWGGVNLYMAAFDGTELRHFEQDDEVHAAFPVGALWCFVRETSVTLFDPSAGREVDRYEHNEVITSQRWSGDRLLLTDFEGQPIAFRLPIGTTTLTQQSAI